MGQENRILASRQLYFDIVFKNLVNKAVGPGGWSVVKLIKEIFKRVLSPARDGYATVLELLGSADRCERAGIFSHNQSVASQIFLKGIGKGNNYCAFLVIIRNNHYLCSDNYYNTENYAIIVNTRKCAVNITKC